MAKADNKWMMILCTNDIINTLKSFVVVRNIHEIKSTCIKKFNSPRNFTCKLRHSFLLDTFRTI